VGSVLRLREAIGSGAAGRGVHSAELEGDAQRVRGVCPLHGQRGEQHPEVRATHLVAVALPHGLQHRHHQRSCLYQTFVGTGVAEAAVRAHEVRGLGYINLRRIVKGQSNGLSEQIRLRNGVGVRVGSCGGHQRRELREDALVGRARACGGGNQGIAAELETGGGAGHGGQNGGTSGWWVGAGCGHRFRSGQL